MIEKIELDMERTRAAEHETKLFLGYYRQISGAQKVWNS